MARQRSLLEIPEAFRQKFGYPEMKRKALGLDSARLCGVNPDLTSYAEVPDDYHRRIVGDAAFMKTMEYDDRLPIEPPVQLRSERLERCGPD